jgi:glycosyltransferase involved in cell wall biosynthesis
MILVVAPYSPIGSKNPNLGASRKLETIINVLSRVDKNIFLINSAHNMEVERWEGVRERKIEISGVNVVEFTPRLYKNRPLGKLFNLFDISNLINLIESKGVPSLIWVYNGYAFENFTIKALKKRFNSRAILEFEDWHFSRGRGLSIKPLLDYFSWSNVCDLYDASFCVNSNLARIMSSKGVVSYELPGIVSAGIGGLRSESIFKNNNRIVVGYFGGLSVEKGVDQLLRIINKCDKNIYFIICGAGKLLTDVKAIEKVSDGRLRCETNLEFGDMINLMSECDILVNPHKVSEELLDGLFPSKVLEAVGSGRMVISTRLPKLLDKKPLDGICFYDGTDENLINVINKAKSFYNERADVINRSASAACDLFGENSVHEKICYHANK